MSEGYKITRGRIDLPSGVVIAHPFYGPANAKSLRDAIRADGLRESDGAAAAEFLATAYSNPNEPEFEDATGVMRERYFRVFEGHNYDGDSENLFVVSPELIEFDEKSNLVIPDARGLERRIKDGDSRIRALPFSKLYAGASRLSSPEEIRRITPYLNAVYGEEGAENLISVADRTRDKLIQTWFPDMPSAGEQKLRLAALDGSLDGGRLFVGGSYWNDDRNGFAFGVFPDSAKPARKN